MFYFIVRNTHKITKYQLVTVSGKDDHKSCEELCGSFRRAPPKLKNIYYKDKKEKDQMIISHMACFCGTGVKFEQCNINIFCLIRLNKISDYYLKSNY